MNYIKIVFRTLLRNLSFSWVNMIALATVMTAFLLILMYVSFESSYEKYHAQVNQVCRLSINTSKHPRHTCCTETLVKKSGERVKKCACS
jgi:putative ABC transport system permease protein